MTDLLERLRNPLVIDYAVPWPVAEVIQKAADEHGEAANEIERLSVLAKANNTLARLNGDHRDAWRAKAVAYAEALDHLADAVDRFNGVASLSGVAGRYQGAMQMARADALRILASVDTRPKDEDPLGASLASGAVPATPGDAQTSEVNND